MAWLVTLRVTDCAGAPNGAILPGSVITDGQVSFVTDANGEFIAIIDDFFNDYIVSIFRTTGGVNGTGYTAKSVQLNKAQDAGKRKEVCLNSAPPAPPTCFTGDTQVTLAGGTEQAIASIRVGDLVLGRFGQPNRVIGIERPPLGHRLLYAFNGGDPFVTAEHPFLTARGWKAIDPTATAVENPHLKVARLTVNDHLLKLERCAVLVGSSGVDAELEPVLEPIPLAHLEGTPADPRMRLYNLLLDGDHAYFANGLLVHNKGCFIVSATTGSDQSKEVNRLRTMRDRVSAASRLSGQLIDSIYRDYYQFSPPIAEELKQDESSRQAVLWIVVRPLLSWYSLAATLAFNRSDRRAIKKAVRAAAVACPAFLDPPSIAKVLDAIRSGKKLPPGLPEGLLEFIPKIREATRLQFASWAILDPLASVWHAAAGHSDLVKEVARWLATAPLESLPQPATPEELRAELKALSDMLAFDPTARRQLGKRLLAAWPDVALALDRNGFA